MLEALDVSQDRIGVGGDVGDVVGLFDHPVWTDQECVAAGVAGVCVARVADDLVLRSDRPVDVAEQPVREVLILGEGKILWRACRTTRRG